MTTTMSKFGWCTGHEIEQQHSKCPKEFTNNVSDYTLKCDCECHEQK
jgi:hypothetical protein